MTNEILPKNVLGKELPLWLTEINPTSIHEDSGLTPGLAQWAKDLALLWLWCRLATVAPIRPLDRELPYAVSKALKSGGGEAKLKYLLSCPSEHTQQRL